MKSKQTILSFSFRRSAFGLLLAVAAMAAMPSNGMAQRMPPAAVAEDPANNAVAEKRSSGIMATLKLNDAEQAARVKQYIVNFVLTLKNIYEGKNPPAADAKRAALLEAREALYTGMNVEKLTAEQQLVVKNGLSANHFKINYDAFIDLVPKLTEEEKAYIHAQLAVVCDEAVLLNVGTEKGDLFHKARGRINNYLSKNGHDLKALSVERNARNKDGKTASSDK